MKTINEYMLGSREHADAIIKRAIEDEKSAIDLGKNLKLAELFQLPRFIGGLFENKYLLEELEGVNSKETDNIIIDYILKGIISKSKNIDSDIKTLLSEIDKKLEDKLRKLDF